MPSLVKKMFDTMPLKGVLGAVGKSVAAATPPTLGQMKRHITVHRKPPTHTVDPVSPAAGEPANKAEIWGWSTTGDPSQVTNVTCRVRDMSFAKCLVLENLSFGYAPTNDATHLRREVLVVFDGKPTVLPLTAEYHLVSFRTREGYIEANDKELLWPLESHHDESLLHVLVYDLDRVSGAVLPLGSPSHPDKKEVEAMLDRLDQMAKASPDDTRNASDFLFKDDLWDPTPSNTPPTATVPEDVALSLKAVRIVVACSLTVCRERDDYTPGKLGGVARLYPHLLVVATSELDRVEAGIHFKRPTKTKTLDRGFAGADPHAHHAMLGADEMLPEIKSLLISDANVGSVILHNVPQKLLYGQMVPSPYWASLFHYYVVDPIKDPAVGTNLIPVVRRSKATIRNKSAYVSRDCSDIIGWNREEILSSTVNAHRLFKRERQGYFDNIHVAPRMRVGANVAKVVIRNLTGYNTEVPVDRVAWKMDEVVMAPFCVHDCFHMHWRWSDNANVEDGTKGWGPAKPWSEVGRVMVPENQDVFLQLLGHAEFSYLAQAFKVPKDVWQPFCHHGAGYAVRVGQPMEQARAGLLLNAANTDKMRFYDSKGNRVDEEGWAVFYWRLRYRLVGSGKSNAGRYFSVTLEERFSFDSKGSERDAFEL